jgi:3-deoxy-7-phosphoheptulonate synthase
MVDCSHANSGKNHENQPLVAEEIARQVSKGSHSIFGVMLESFLVAGRQDAAPGKALHRGQSITDACLGWDETVPVLRNLARAVKLRRGSSG